MGLYQTWKQDASTALDLLDSDAVLASRLVVMLGGHPEDYQEEMAVAIERNLGRSDEVLRERWNVVVQVCLVYDRGEQRKDI